MGKYIFQKLFLFAQVKDGCFVFFLPIIGLKCKKFWVSGSDSDLPIHKRKTDLSEGILTHGDQLFALILALQAIKK